MKAWEQMPLRTCMTMHECKLCGKKISLGERYYDGGYRYRAHLNCVIRLRETLQKPPTTQREQGAQP